MQKSKSPVIGILCVDIANKLRESYGNEFKSYIAASYVKYLESAGAEVVPIWIGKSKEYYENILKEINGVLLPGGALFFDQPNGYADAGRYIYKIALEMNEKGDYFPLWGTCLGYELLLYVSSANGNDPRQDCSAMNDSIPLSLKYDCRNSRMFKNLPVDIENILKSENVTYNIHRYCITEKDLENFGLKKSWRVMSTNKDKDGLEFISTIEHEKYPFYGVQFHPEKIAYETGEVENMCHSTNAIKSSQYFAHFFVNDCKKNEHKFTNQEEEYRHLIYNFPVTFTGLKIRRWTQCYLFKEDADYPVVE